MYLNWNAVGEIGTALYCFGGVQVQMYEYVLRFGKGNRKCRSQKWSLDIVSELARSSALNGDSC